MDIDLLQVLLIILALVVGLFAWLSWSMGSLSNPIHLQLIHQISNQPMLRTTLISMKLELILEMIFLIPIFLILC